MRKSAALVVFAACLLAGGTAHAVAPGLGELKAVSNGAEVPPGTAVAIRPDESDALVGTAPAYVAARAAAADALRGLGLRPDDGARLILKIEISTPHFDTHMNGDEESTSIISTDAARQIGPNRKARVTDQVHLPFEAPESKGQPGLSVALLLLDERGRPLWTATFQAGGRVADADAMIRRMTRAAVAALGAQVQRSYVLACEKEGDKVANDGSVCLP